MKVIKNGEFSMNRKEVEEFSAWFDKNPRERYKRFNEAIQAFIAYKNNKYSVNEWILDEAQ